MSGSPNFIAKTDAVILAQLSEEGKVSLACVFHRDAQPSDISFNWSMGAVYSEWCLGDASMTPEGSFAHLMSCGFSSADALRETLFQFSQIDVCDWARTMFAALERSDG